MIIDIFHNIAKENLVILGKFKIKTKKNSKMQKSPNSILYGRKIFYKWYVYSNKQKVNK
jgi:hypothetical protein